MAVAQAKKPKFTTFEWEGTDKQGRKTRGEMEAASDAFVKASLRRQGISPSRVTKKRKPLFVTKKRIIPKDIAVFTRQLATMLEAGIPLAQAFDIVGRGHENPSMSDLILSVKQDLESGTNLTEALGKHPLYFDALYCNLVAAGEQAGILDNILEKLATYKEKIEAIKGKIKSAMFYPAAVVVVAFVVTAILMVFVIPQFQSLYEGFGADLPALTKMVIDISKVFQDWWWAITFGLVGGVIFIGYTYRRSTKMQHTVDRLLLKAPIFGPIVKKATIARFCRTLSTMFAAGNRVYYEATVQIRADVSTGMQLQAAMNATKLFPNMVIQMVAIGEESGELDAMLSKVADFYEDEVDDAVAALSSLLEPIIMVFLGVLIGGMVIAMYLPIFKMASTI
jgi:type IV pilus assembly protein PilC